ncbi:integrase, catalytic region, zinc finger, CCHC-type containing protein [Tanacetum coccineum]
MLERGSCIPWASHFRRYLNRKRDNRKWLNKAIDEGPCEFRIFTPSDTEAPRMQKEEDLRGDDLKHYEAEIEAMNLILISIPNDIYNSVDACKTAKSMWQRVERLMRGTVQTKVDRETRFNNEFYQFVAEPGEALVSKLANASRAKKVEKSHDPLALVAYTGSSSRTTTPYYVTHPSSVVDYDEDYQRDAVQNNSKDSLTSIMILLARTAANVQCYNCSEKGHYARNYPKPRVRDSKYFMEQMLLAKQDEARVILTDKHNDFLFVDASRMEEIEELSANICLMAKIQPANFDSDEGPSYEYAFLSEVRTPSTSYENPLFSKDTQAQKYPKQPKIINNTIGDDQIDSNIIFDKPNGDVNSDSVEYDNNVEESYALE